MHPLKILACVILTTGLFSSCMKHENSSNKMLLCENIQNIEYAGENKLNYWLSEVVSDDTAKVHTYLDTLIYIQDTVVNTISFTYFHDEIVGNSAYEEYIKNEKKNIINTFNLSSSGQFYNKKTRCNWFLVKDGEKHSYIVYILNDFMSMLYLSTSVQDDYLKTLCGLAYISEQHEN